MIDVFGPGGSKRFGVSGALGKVEAWRDEATLALIAVYTRDQVGTLYESAPLPIPTWPWAAANDER